MANSQDYEDEARGGNPSPPVQHILTFLHPGRYKQSKGTFVGAHAIPNEM